MNNKNVEQSIEEVLEQRLRDEAIKQYKKHWSEIVYPFTLHEGLNKYKKYELDTIRKTLDIKNASGLKKLELTTVLAEAIPEKLIDIISHWDKDRFQLLLKIANNGGKMQAPDIQPEQVEYFRDIGLIYTGTIEGNKVLAVPEDLIAPILEIKNRVNIRSTIKRNTEWIKLTHGLLYYYGTLSVDELSELVESYTNDTVDFAAFLHVIYEAKFYYEEIAIDEYGFSHRDVEDPVQLKQEHQRRNDITFYPFTKQQLITAGEPGFVDRNKSYVQLVNTFTELFDMDKEVADSIVEECVYATRLDESPNDIIKFLSEIVEFDSTETLQTVMDNVVLLMNHTKSWTLKGYTPVELRKKAQGKSKSSQATPKEKQSVKVVKIGRNQPCPCGSGKKYKKCCGR